MTTHGMQYKTGRVLETEAVTEDEVALHKKEKAEPQRMRE
jgi:hypothetical protein